MQNFLDCIRSGKETELPVRTRLPRVDRLPHGGGELSPGPHDALGSRRRKRSSELQSQWISNTRRNRSSFARPFASSREAEITPHVMEWDEAQTFPLEVVKKLGELGVLGAIFPEELGGAGLGYVEYSHHHRRTGARGSARSG